MLGARLNTIHNLHYYQSLMKDLRAAIEAQDLDAFILRDVFHAGGTDAVIVPAVVILVGRIEIRYARSVDSPYDQ